MFCSLRLTLALGCGLLILVVSYLTAMESELPVPDAPGLSSDLTTTIACQDDEGGAGEQNASSPRSVAEIQEGLRVEGGQQGNAQQEAAIREILEFRHQQGNLFRGTVLDCKDAAEADKAFLQALRSVVRQQGEQPAGTVDRTAVSARTRGCEAAYARQMRQQQPVGSPMAHRPGEANDGALVTALWQACRELDRKADDLEDLDQYSEVDRLRDLACQLQREAQRWTDADFPAPAPQVEPQSPLVDPTVPQ